MNLRQEIGQHLIIGIKGKTLLPEEKTFLVQNNIGGIILFARNVESAEQVLDLCTETQSLRHQLPEKTPFFISVDMEGGRVARFKVPPFTLWPPLSRLGEIDSTTLAFKFAQAMGQELAAVGVNLDFAPSLDVLTNPKNTVIGDRSLGSDPEKVERLGSAIIRGYIKAGVMTCAKHFPGHGNTIIDSHEDLPVEENSDMLSLEATELVPFKKAFRSRVDFVMGAHIKFPKIDPSGPVTFSSKFLQEILRNQLGYRQLVITDDLDMKALAKYHPQEVIPVRALQAGVDVLLYCNDQTKPPMALEAIEKAVEKKELDLNNLRSRLSRIAAHKKARMVNIDPPSKTEMQNIVGCDEHKQISEIIKSGHIPENFET